MDADYVWRTGQNVDQTLPLHINKLSLIHLFIFFLFNFLLFMIDTTGCLC